MTRTRPLALVLLLAALTLLGAAGPASAATTINDVARSLRSNPVYVDPQATADIDVGQVTSAIRSSGRAVYVAVLPQAAANNSGGPERLTASLGAALGDQAATLFTVSGNTVVGQAGNRSGLGTGEAQSIVNGTRGDLTDRIVTAIERADEAAADGPSGPSSTDTSTGGDSGSTGGGAVLALLAVLGIGGGGLLYARSRKRRLGEMQGSRADVESLYGRLGADVSNLHAGDDAVARQALADAAERYNATGALLSQADTPGEFEAARRTVVEGLTAARLARTRLGLDPGPEIPPPPGSGPQLQAAERVRVGDDEYDGSPTYAPGRQHYWGGGMVGGSMVPGGWYGVPFWQTMLLGSALSGGFGGGYGYGGGGYERGYEEGVDDARDAQSGGGGGWGDWGGGGGGFGGGDWGGGGGGDWGGGGFGGGGDGGGSW